MNQNKDGMPAPFYRGRWHQNVYVALLLSLGLMMALYSISRVGFYLFNRDAFAGMDVPRFLEIMRGGLRFDLTAVLYSNVLFILLMAMPFRFRFLPWYRNMLWWIFVVVNSVALAMNTADFIYYRFTLRRTTASVFGQFKNEQNGISLFFSFITDYWQATLFWLGLVALMVWLFRKIKYSGPQFQNPWVYYIASALALPLAATLFVGGVRGGFLHSTRPITISNAAAYSKIAKDANLVLNTPFSIMLTSGTSVIQKVNYFPEDSVAQVFNPLKPADTSGFRSYNVVVIIVESFSKEFIGRYNRWMDPARFKGYTPFLDSLADHSRAFEYSLANGRKSIDAMPSVIASIPAIEMPYVLSHFSGNKINSTPGLLKEKGYYTAFFHGAPNGSMGFDAFANLCGFDDYFGKTEYNNDDDYDGIWGIWDEPFLQYFAHKMNGFKQPFHTTLFTVSSHHPYNLPEGLEKKYPGGDRPIYKTIQYTDNALRRFFQTASTMPWYKNTLFVITADHASAEVAYPEYQTQWGFFSIPILFYAPGENWHSFSPQIVQQIDIMPTIMGYLHYDKPFVAFGENAFSEHGHPFAFNYLDNNYQMFQDDFLLLFDGKENKALYNFKTDKLLKNNMLTQLPDTARVMERRLKGLIQQYNNRMVEDNLTRAGKMGGMATTTK